MPNDQHASHPRPAGRLVLIRHGSTAWSKSGQHTGLTDVPLLPEGEDDARALRGVLGDYNFVMVRCSPLHRARRTAELAGLADPIIDERLVEWDYGGYEGRTTVEIRAELGRRWTVFEDGVIPGQTPGETVEQVAARASTVLADCIPELLKGDVALVGHGHCMRVLAATFLRQGARFGAQLVFDAGHVSVLGWEHELPVILHWNQGSSHV